MGEHPLVSFLISMRKTVVSSYKCYHLCYHSHVAQMTGDAWYDILLDLVGVAYSFKSSARCIADGRIITKMTNGHVACEHVKNTTPYVSAVREPDNL